MAAQNPAEPRLIHRCPTCLLSRTPDELIAAHEFVSGAFRAADGSDRPGEVQFDLEPCEEIDPGALLLLMHAGDLLGRSGWRALVSGKSQAFQMVVEHLTHWLKPPDERRAQQRPKGDYLLRDISSQNEMVSELGEWSETVQEGSTATPEDVALWQCQISEVLTNAFQHGRPTTPSMVAGKAYGTKHRVQLAALDYGVSIPKTIAPVAKEMGEPLEDGDLVRFAARNRVTCRSVRQNQGAGLYNLVETVRKNGGRLLILSGNGLFHVSNGRRYRRNLDLPSSGRPAVSGTLTIVNLRIP